MRRASGFTLIEILIVVAILVALAWWAKDPDPRYFVMARVREALQRFETIKPQIASYHQRTKRWPSRNDEVPIPEDGFLQGKSYSFHVQADGGVLARVYSSKGEVGALSLRPALDANGNVLWLCGNAKVAPGYAVIGANRTTLKGSERQLPKECDDR